MRKFKLLYLLSTWGYLCTYFLNVLAFIGLHGNVKIFALNYLYFKSLERKDCRVNMNVLLWLASFVIKKGTKLLWFTTAHVPQKLTTAWNESVNLSKCFSSK